jgi:3-hydroxymyristoyl/3-hydroxydecanoyl-(acyl carrier protein) dehydratase
LSLPCPVTNLIPQKGKMGFQQILTLTNGDLGQSEATINADHLFLDDRGQLSNSALIEYVNQLVAAAQGYKEIANKAPAQKGLFVGLQETEFFQPLHSGDIITLKKALIEEVAPVNFVQGDIKRNGEPIATFVTKIYEVKDFTKLYLASSSDALPDGQITSGRNVVQSPNCLGSKLRRQLYTYMHDLKIDADGIAFKIVCPVDFEAYDGHFPGNPILPGIVLLEIAQAALGLVTQRPVELKTIKKMKISGVVLPGQEISVTVKIGGCDPGARPSFTAIFRAEPTREVSRFQGSFDEGRQ